jgi:hypothetical protein
MDLTNESAPGAVRALAMVDADFMLTGAAREIPG